MDENIKRGNLKQSIFITSLIIFLLVFSLVSAETIENSEEEGILYTLIIRPFQTFLNFLIYGATTEYGECYLDHQCYDNNPCTMDYCLNGKCENEYEPNLPGCGKELGEGEKPELEDEEEEGDECQIDSDCGEEEKSCSADNEVVTKTPICENGECASEESSDFCDDDEKCVEIENEEGDIIDAECILVECENDEDCEECSKCSNGKCVYDNMASCDDEDECTVNFCSSGKCLSYPIDCSSKNPCVSAKCDSDKGCVYEDIEGCKPCYSAPYCSICSNNTYEQYTLIISGNKNGGCEKFNGIFNLSYRGKKEINDKYYDYWQISSFIEFGDFKYKYVLISSFDCVYKVNLMRWETNRRGIFLNETLIASWNVKIVNNNQCSEPNLFYIDSFDSSCAWAESLEIKAGNKKIKDECDDGNICNGIETCNYLPGDYIYGVCEEGEPLYCDDGNICNGEEYCDYKDGCKQGEPLDCDDGVSCTIDSCDKWKGCLHQPFNGLCEEWEVCNPDSGCEQAKCRGCSDCDNWLSLCGVGECHSQCSLEEECYYKGFSLFEDDCISLENACNLITSCSDYSKEECINDPCKTAITENGCILDGNQCKDAPYCGDGNCDVGENCNNCLDCECQEGLKCFEGKCVECVFDGDCNDNDLCNGEETCVNGQCLQGNLLNCDDGNVCNGLEICDSIFGCLPGEPLDCDDGDECTEDSCNSLLGCINEDICTCVPDCSGPDSIEGTEDDKVCGDDGCGGSCGECSEGEVCSKGKCVSEGFGFPEGSLVLMADGTYKNIENISIGDSVMSFDWNINQRVSGEVIRIKNESGKDNFKIVFNDSSFNVAKGVNIYTIDGWKTIDFKNDSNEIILKIGDNVYLDDGEVLKEVIEIVYLEDILKNYHLEIKDYHNFYIKIASDALVDDVMGRMEGPCVPDCSDSECGDDGCGGSCGECSEGEVCLGGRCEDEEVSCSFTPIYCEYDRDYSPEITYYYAFHNRTLSNESNNYYKIVNASTLSHWQRPEYFYYYDMGVLRWTSPATIFYKSGGYYYPYISYEHHLDYPMRTDDEDEIEGKKIELSRKTKDYIRSLEKSGKKVVLKKGAPVYLGEYFITHRPGFKEQIWRFEAVNSQFNAVKISGEWISLDTGLTLNDGSKATITREGDFIRINWDSEYDGFEYEAKKPEEQKILCEIKEIKKASGDIVYDKYCFEDDKVCGTGEGIYDEYTDSCVLNSCPRPCEEWNEDTEEWEYTCKEDQVCIISSKNLGGVCKNKCSINEKYIDGECVPKCGKCEVYSGYMKPFSGDIYERVESCVPVKSIYPELKCDEVTGEIVYEPLECPSPTTCWKLKRCSYEIENETLCNEAEGEWVEHERYKCTYPDGRARWYYSSLEPYRRGCINTGGEWTYDPYYDCREEIRIGSRNRTIILDTVRFFEKIPAEAPEKYWCSPYPSRALNNTSEEGIQDEPNDVGRDFFCKSSGRYTARGGAFGTCFRYKNFSDFWKTLWGPQKYNTCSGCDGVGNAEGCGPLITEVLTCNYLPCRSCSPRNANIRRKNILVSVGSVLPTSPFYRGRYLNFKTIIEENCGACSVCNQYDEDGNIISGGGLTILDEPNDNTLYCYDWADNVVSETKCEPKEEGEICSGEINTFDTFFQWEDKGGYVQTNYACDGEGVCKMDLKPEIRDIDYPPPKPPALFCSLEEGESCPESGCLTTFEGTFSDCLPDISKDEYVETEPYLTDDCPQGVCLTDEFLPDVSPEQEFDESIIAFYLSLIKKLNFKNTI